MPAVLTDRKTCDSRVPGCWENVLFGLREFAELESQLRAARPQAPSSEQMQRLRQLHDQLVERSAVLLEPATLADFTPQHDARLFAQAVFTLSRINQCVAADVDVLDTAGSRTLHLFEADFYQSDHNRQRLMAALAGMPGLNCERLALLEQQVERDARDASRKQAVVRAIRDEFQLWRDSPNLRSGIHNLFEALYPGTRFAADEIELIATGSMIFFCLPFQGTELQEDHRQQRDPQQQQSILEFLQRLARFSQWQFAHFPVFGFMRGEQLDADLLARLAARAAMQVGQVAHEISRLVAIVPLRELDKYVVHDVWGHGWQASLLRFDDLYEKLATYAQPLLLSEAATAADGRTLTLDDCFRGGGDRLQLDDGRFREFVELEVAERLPVALTPVLAEVLADVAEFKLIATHDRHADVLPSSSLLKMLPAKLDLLMQDLPFYFPQATKVFRLWADRADRQQRTVEELVERGATTAAARREVSRAVQVWRDLEQGRFAPRIDWSRDGESLQVNVMTRVALNFLGIHRAVLHAYQQIDRIEPGNLPLRSFKDLLLIAAAVFFQDDPARNLWRVDEYLSLRIAPLCQQLAAACKENR